MDHIKQLKRSGLFSGYSEEEIKGILNNVSYQIKSYDKGELVKKEGDELTSLGIILSGQTAVTRRLGQDNDITVSELGPGQSIAEAAVFSKKDRYPATVKALDSCTVIFLQKSSILALLQTDPRFADGIIKMLSDRIILLNDTINLLSHPSIKEKLAYYLLTESKIKNSILFTINYTRSTLAEKLNIPRPSLSRVLSEMKHEGLIDYHKNTFKVVDIDELTKVIC